MRRENCPDFSAPALASGPFQRRKASCAQTADSTHSAQRLNPREALRRNAEEVAAWPAYLRVTSSAARTARRKSMERDAYIVFLTDTGGDQWTPVRLLAGSREAAATLAVREWFGTTPPREARTVVILAEHATHFDLRVSTEMEVVAESSLPNELEPTPA